MLCKVYPISFANFQGIFWLINSQAVTVYRIEFSHHPSSKLLVYMYVLWYLYYKICSHINIIYRANTNRGRWRREKERDRLIDRERKGEKEIERLQEKSGF